jgi:hypothetical protein
MNIYEIKAFVPATVIATIVIEAENNLEAMEKFNLGDYKIINEHVSKVDWNDADIDYIKEH